MSVENVWVFNNWVEMKGSTIELRMIDKLEKWLVGVILGIRIRGVGEVS